MFISINNWNHSLFNSLMQIIYCMPLLYLVMPFAILCGKEINNHEEFSILNQCRIVKKIPITLITPYPALPQGEGFGMGVWKYAFSQKLLTKRY